MVSSEAGCRGFVLTGGRSHRMGQEKALLAFAGRPLAVWMAQLAQRLCREVTLVGDATKYSGLGYPVIEDAFPGRGPLGGIHAALECSEMACNLILGCDMPYLTSEFLEFLVHTAAADDSDAVVPEAKISGYEPLCAVYRRSCLPAFELALRGGDSKVIRALERVRVRRVTCAEWQPYDPDGNLFRNLNRPEDYQRAIELLASAAARMHT